MNVRLSAVLALLLGFGLLTTAPTARAAADELVITGSHSAVMDVSFPRGLRLSAPRVDITGGGAWTGLVIERIEQGQPKLKLAALRGAAFTGRDALVHLSSGDFAPGRYRIRLLTDRFVSVTLPVALDGAVLHPTRRIAVTVSTGAGRVAAGSSQGAVPLSHAVPAGRGALLLSAVSGIRAEDTRICVTTASTCSRSVSPAAPPDPVPSPPDVSTPTATSEDPRLVVLPLASRTTRRALLTTQGVRTQDGTMRLFCLAYS